MRIKGLPRDSRILLAFLFVALLLSGSAVAANTASAEASSGPEKSPPAASEQKPSKNGQPREAEAQEQTGFGEQLARESREAAGEEDQTEQFKDSASVRLLARLTGMSPRHAYWLAVVLNFAVIAVLIGWIARSRLPGVLRDRTVSIQKAMEEARRTSEEANQRLAEIEARLSKLDIEIGEMRATADRESAEEEARVRAAAEEDARKIIAAAEQEIAAAAKSARRDLKAFAANLAVSLAERQIKVDRATDQALVQKFSGQLGAETNGSRKDTR
jgi:F-type H+-transporting ATPase subunit b